MTTPALVRHWSLFGFGLLALLATAASAPAAEWTASTFAGTGVAGDSGDGGPAKSAQLSNPFGIARGPDGAIYFCEFSGHRIRRVAPNGAIETVAGTGEAGGGGDGGPAKQARLNQPHEIRFDRQGNYYISDMLNHAIRRVDRRTGVITTVAGTGQPGYSGDGGPATAAQLRSPISLQFAPTGDLYICDLGNHVIRKLDAKTGLIATVAGTGHPGASPDGAPIAGAPLNGPRSLDFDAAGHLWLCTREGNQVLELDLAAGRIHLIAGTGKKGLTGNGGPAREATFNGPKGIALGRGGEVYVADTENHCIRVIDPKSGLINGFAGTGEKGDGPEGSALHCKLNRPHGVFVDASGAAFVSSSEASRIWLMKP